MTEILAPCGSLETLCAALRAGCSAVYLGGECFSARQNAANFTKEELKEAVRLCHKRGVKVYQAINTVIFDSQLEECKSAVRFACEIGIDGLITQDLALVEIVKNCCEDMEIHASTQMTVHTENGVELTKMLGFSRTVLSRELPFEIIKKLCGLGTEIEVFVHGALCMSVSGQCYMSAVIGSRSANRGLCAQACRLPCSAVKGEERFDLSLKDMSYIYDLRKLEHAGAASLKIEGRMKRPEYVAMAVDCCKKALNGENFDSQTLAGVFSRGGFTSGYLEGKLGKEMFGTRQLSDVKASAEALPKIHELYRYEEKRDTVSFKFTAKQGENISLEIFDTQGNSTAVSGEIPTEAKNRPIDCAAVEKQLSKLGETIYEFGRLECNIDDGLWVSPSELNALRRKVCLQLDEIRIKKNTKTPAFENRELFEFEEISPSKQPKIRIGVTKLSQLSKINFEDIELCAVSIDSAKKAAEDFPVDKLAVCMPRFTFNEETLIQKLKDIKKSGISKMLATNIAHVKIAEDLGFELHLGYGYNLTNSVALNAVKKLGAKDAEVSFELKAGQINALKKPLPIGVYAYGRLPLMLTVNCPISQAVGCKNCKKSLWDRTGREFKVKCQKSLGYVEIMNSDILYIADKLDKFKGIDFISLNFFDESPEQVEKIIEEYKKRCGEKPKNATAGLYFRGVL